MSSPTRARRNMRVAAKPPNPPSLQFSSSSHTAIVYDLAFIHSLPIVHRGLRTFSRSVNMTLILLLAILFGVRPIAHAQAGAPVPFTEFNAVTSSGVQTNGTILPQNVIEEIGAHIDGQLD